MTPLAFELLVRRLDVLPRLLLLVARLGGEVESLEAHDSRVMIRINAPEMTAHRFGPQFKRVVDVLAVNDLQIPEAGECQG
jgi:hypothetical protein